MIEVLAGRGGCLTAKELEGELAGGERPVGIAIDLPLARRARGRGPRSRRRSRRRRASLRARPPDGSHHHHVVCDRCGRTLAFTDPDLERAIDASASGSVRDVDAHDVVLRGLCRSCSDRWLTARASGATVRADAAQHDLVPGDVEVDPPGQRADRRLERLVVERRHLAAGVADEMVMVVLGDGAVRSASFPARGRPSTRARARPARRGSGRCSRGRRCAHRRAAHPRSRTR